MKKCWQYRFIHVTFFLLVVSMYSFGAEPPSPTQNLSRHLAAVNQIGYQTDWPKRFTAPLSDDGIHFIVCWKDDPAPLFTGVIKDHVGDFSQFQPADTANDYVVVLKGGTLGECVSDPFLIRKELWREQLWPSAIDFMIDCRAVVGTHCSAFGGSPWRDGCFYDFAVPSLIFLYEANPGLIESLPHQMDWEKDKTRVFAPDFPFKSDKILELVKRYYAELEAPMTDAPDVAKLIHWGLGWYLVQFGKNEDKVNAQIVEHFAYLLSAWPRLKLDRWLPASFYDRCREFAQRHWERSGLLAIDPEWNSKKWISLEADNLGQGLVLPYKGHNAPGHSIVPNLLMYELASRTKDPMAAKYQQAAREQAAWIIAHLDLQDPRSTKGMRMSEHRTIPSLVWFLQHHPESAPPDLKAYITAWASIMVKRSANLWDFRRFDLENRWSLPSFNEPGNLAGFPACALAASWVVDDSATVQRLREISVAQFDNLFGRNPKFAASPSYPKNGFPLIERGWPIKYRPNTCAVLELVRGSLSASPGTEMYPFIPDGKFRHCEGWVNFNTAWNVGLAYFAWDAGKQAPTKK